MPALAGSCRPRPAPSCRESKTPMFDLGPHGGFIVAAYAFTALVMAGLVGNAIRDRVAQRRALRRFGEERR
jgi:heme exporter protein D